MSDFIKFGNNNPPYSLYQNEEGLWGLIDGSGNKLPAEFNRGEKNCFSCVPWEVVTFNEQEGFELVAWYDPCEVWFNFTFDDPAYPDEYSHYMWKPPQNQLESYVDIIYFNLSSESHWLIDCILKVRKFSDMDWDETDECINSILADFPTLKNYGKTNEMIEPIMSNTDIEEDIRHALWVAKVSLDNHIRNFIEEYPDGYKKL